MATRADRLNERLRGAQRTNVDEEDTFGLDLDLGIPGIEIPPASAPEPAVAPGAAGSPVSAKRRKLNGQTSQSQPVRRSASRSAERNVAPRPRGSSNVPSIPEEPEDVNTGATAGTNGATRVELPVRLSNRTQPSHSTGKRRRDDGTSDEDAVKALIVSEVVASSETLSREVIEEIEESPRNAPGSGKRRRVVNTEIASASSVRLRDAVAEESSPAPLSSPSAQRARRSTVGRSTLGTAEPEQQAEGATPGTAPGARVLRSASRSISSPPEQPIEETPVPAAKRGRGRPRSSGVSSRSPELGSPTKDRQGPEEQAGGETPVQMPPPKKRGRPPKAKGQTPPTRRQPGRVASASKSPAQSSEVAEEEEQQQRTEGETHLANAPQPRNRRSTRSPIVQRQPARRSPRTSVSPNQTIIPRQPKPKTAQAAAKPKAKPKGRPRASNASNGTQDAEAEDDAAIEIIVQRYINHKRNSEDEDPLHSELPFANRTGESTVDVLAQICGEVIENTLGQFLELLGKTEVAGKKKEYRVKMRAIDAYKEELSARLLQHAIHLDHWHSLRKRVKHVQKEKLSLRGEIMQLKAEREQVALRMDAIRTRHEADAKESKYRLDASAMMHDIELAVERGMEAPELSPKAQKEAELANLEFVVAQVSDQASSNSATGGLYRQLADFNSFLERAAVALESRS